MQAIETIYKGYRMRSRLEARWGIFFDALDIKWEYEKEGFKLREGIQYLPDFWLPELKYWIEIKGQDPTPEEEEKCSKFGEQISQEENLFLFVGSIELPPDEYNHGTRGYVYTKDGKKDKCGWVECPFCGRLEIIEGQDIFRTGCGCIEKCYNMKAILEVTGKAYQEGDPRMDGGMFNYVVQKLFYWHNTPHLINAYTAARQARFEFGGRL